MQRLVYSPKAYVFVRTQDSPQGLDISDFVVSGNVNRVINEVSTAQVTLRNSIDPDRGSKDPTKYGRFTADVEDPTGPGLPTFHPMDPITIFLARYTDKPVQVFTGYLDTTPYVQLFPGTITLQASCTLKRLLYTYFDPALPFTESYMKQFGWIANYEGSLTNFEAVGQTLNPTSPQLTDSGFGDLLYHVLKDIGAWTDDEIYIENLPDGIVDTVRQVFGGIAKDNALAEKDLSQVIGKMVGTSTAGIAGGTSSGSASKISPTTGSVTATGNVKGANKIVPIMVSISKKYNIPPALTIAVALIETGLSNSDSSSYYGWFQMQIANPPYAYGMFSHRPPTVAEAHDLGIATTGFCQAAAGWANTHPSYRNDLYTWAIYTQGVEGNLGGQSSGYRYRGGFDQYLNQAKALISRYGGELPTVNANGQVVSTKASKGGKTSNTNFNLVPGANTVNSAVNQSGLYVNPVAHVNNLVPRAIDEGVDFHGTGPVTAIGDATIFFVSTSLSNWPGGNYIAYRLDSGPATHKGHFVYVAEYIHPVVKAGDKVKANQVIGNMYAPPGATGIEMGWAVPGPMKTYRPPLAHLQGAGSAGQYTGAGQAFENLLLSLGAPPANGRGAVGQSQPMIGSVSIAPGAVPSAWATTPGAVIGASSSGASSSNLGVPGQSGTIMVNYAASAFAAQIDWPTAAQTIEAELLQGQKSLMNDQPLLPFIQQLASASLRSFQSLPNGAFFGFFPDYFGTYFHRQPYWEIDKIEILDGRIDLTDDNLVTHMYVVGDRFPLPNMNEMQNLINEIMSGGVVTVFNAFQADWLADGEAVLGSANAKQTQPPKKLLQLPKGTKTLHDTETAIAFLQKFGARPLKLDEPMIRSPFFEAFMAFQQFQLAWSRQFLTTFQFTFMPELFPGGRVYFKDYGFACYIDQVQHSWDYETGFTTDVNLSAPSAVVSSAGAGANPVARGMIEAAPAVPTPSPSQSSPPPRHRRNVNKK